MRDLRGMQVYEERSRREQREYESTSGLQRIRQRNPKSTKVREEEGQAKQNGNYKRATSGASTSRTRFDKMNEIIKSTR